MSPEGWIALAITAGALVLFVTEALSVDLVGLLVMATLVMGGVLTPKEAVAGFASDALITIAAMFVLSAGLIRAGALEHVTGLMFRLARGSHRRLIVTLMLTVALSSAFLNNTPVAVIFLPIVLGVAATFDMAPSKLLIPMSYATILGGTCTLIGTSTNLLVAEVAEQHQQMTIGMFDFSVPGLLFAGAGLVFLALCAPRLLPVRASVSSATQGGRIKEFVTEVYLKPDSPVVGRSYQELLSKLPAITPLMLMRGDDVIFAPLVADPRAQFVRAGDILLLKGDPGSINALLERDGVALPPELGDLLARQGAGKTMTMVELVINPNSPLIGRTIGGSHFSKRHGGAAAIAILRHDEHLRKRVPDIRLRLGDTLLVVCDESALGELQTSDEFLLLEGVERALVRPDKAPVAAGIMALVVGLATFDVMPIMPLALGGVVLMVLTNCLPMRLAYSSIDMSIVVLIAGMLALGYALETTGVIRAGSDALIGALHDWGPRAVLAGIYVISAVLTALISNSAVAVLITPLAMDTAAGLGFAPAPFVFATLFGASASFATPIGYQTNLFVYAPGGYRFTDYLRIGIPLNVVLFLLALWVIPWYWPFQELT